MSTVSTASTASAVSTVSTLPFFVEKQCGFCVAEGLPELIFANRHDLRLIPAGPSTQHAVLINSLSNSVAIDFHMEKQLIYWTDVIDDKIYRGTRSRDANLGSFVTFCCPVVCNNLFF